MPIKIVIYWCMQSASLTPAIYYARILAEKENFHIVSAKFSNGLASIKSRGDTSEGQHYLIWHN